MHACRALAIIHSVYLFSIIFGLGDDQPSSEDMLDVLSDSTDEIPVGVEEAAHSSEVNSNGENKQETHDEHVCCEVHDLKQDVYSKCARTYHVRVCKYLVYNVLCKQAYTVFMKCSCLCRQWHI